MTPRSTQIPARLGRVLGTLGLALALQLAATVGTAAAHAHIEQLVPILGVSPSRGEEPTGIVANLLMSFEQRDDSGGFVVIFRREPGRFSPLAQTAVHQAILRAARVAGLSPDSWTVVLAVPYPGLTVYGDSLSAMVALSVVALAKGDAIAPDRVMTGSVTPEGRIAPVGSVPQKVEAANHAHMRRIVVPAQVDTGDSDWETPFLVQVSPVGSLSEAYEALTDQPLRNP
jgi:predicted S18 family serine protease